MRRLTLKEKDIVDYINKKKQTNFKQVLKHAGAYPKDYLFKLKENRTGIDGIYYQQVEDVEGFNFEDAQKRPIIENGQLQLVRMLEVAQLLKLLADNHLIFIMDLESEKNAISRTYVSKNKKHLSDETLPSFVGEIGIQFANPIFNFAIDIPDIEVSETFFIIVTSNIYTTQALEIYAADEFRTEEQKQNDEADEHNKHTTLISWLAVGAAILGVIVSGYYSAMTYYDSKADDDKNDFFKNEVMIQVDKMTETIEGIRNDLKKTNPVQTKKDTVK